MGPDRNPSHRVRSDLPEEAASSLGESTSSLPLSMRLALDQPPVIGNQQEQLLWTQDDYRIVMDFLRDKDASSEESRAATGGSSSAEAQPKASLKSLGWALSATVINTTFQVERGGSRIAVGEEPSHDEPTSDRPWAHADEVQQHSHHEEHGDEDLGEAVSDRASWLDHVGQTKDIITAPQEFLGGKPHRKHHELDRNHSLLLEMTATTEVPSQ